MDIEQIIRELRAERTRVDAAISALERGGSGAAKSNGRRGPRQMSPEARRRISEAQKRRWAKRRADGPKVVVAAAKGRKSGGISPAGRKRISEMMKKRWAERRKKAA